MTTPHYPLLSLFTQPTKTLEKITRLESELESLQTLLQQEQVSKQSLQDQMSSQQTAYLTKLYAKQKKYKLLQQKLYQLQSLLQDKSSQLDTLESHAKEMADASELATYQVEIDLLTREEQVLRREADLLGQIEELTGNLQEAQASVQVLEERLRGFEDKVLQQEQEAVVGMVETNKRKNENIMGEDAKQESITSSTSSSSTLLENLSQPPPPPHHHETKNDEGNTNVDTFVPDLVDWARQQKDIQTINQQFGSLDLHQHTSTTTPQPPQKTQEVVATWVEPPISHSSQPAVQPMDGSSSSSKKKNQTKKRLRNRGVQVLTFDTHDGLLH